jgi:hypothetical protein
MIKVGERGQIVIPKEPFLTVIFSSDEVPGMDAGTFVVLWLLLTLVALAIKPVRKAVGLLLVILGTLASLTGIGLIIGIPMILIGGILLFA